MLVIPAAVVEVEVVVLVDLLRLERLEAMEQLPVVAALELPVGKATRVWAEVVVRRGAEVVAAALS